MTKTISLSDEAYNLLKSVKRKDESFSDVIKRLVGGKGRLVEVLDLYPEVAEEEEFEKAVKMVREKLDEDVKRVIDEMP
ncbi:MAG: antitoxin VapB family protein [Candidatus Freyarchaeota archaeon]|nr:antitoxin VapB family protein [Candidatus Freyrarchaeum guaymaensis]